MRSPRRAIRPLDLHRQDEGYALLLTIGIASILAILVSTLTAVSIRETRQSTDDRDTQAALAAADAGIDDYIYRLNRNQDYWQWPDAGIPPDGNEAFTQFVDVPGDSGAEFTYTVDASDLPSTGNIYLQSTGRVNGQTRTVMAQLRRQNFLNYLYFTEYETLSPLVYPYNGLSRAQAEVVCRRHDYDSPSRDSRCIEINWATGDVVNGPFHTNDRFVVYGRPDFRGPATGSAPHPLYKVNNFDGASFQPGYPRRADRLTMPPSNQSIRREADHTIGGEGCLYTGPTEIEFVGTQMWVTSPQTRSSGPGCGTWPGNRQRVNLPSNGVIFVQNVPASQSVSNCGLSNGRNGLGYPFDPSGGGSTNDRAVEEHISYECRSGDAFVEGTVNGRVTVASENNLAIIWHITRADRSASSDDIIGLVAQNLVQIYHPVRGGNLRAGPNHAGEYFRNPQVDAAVLSVTGSFLVPNWADGNALGDISVRGAIAQVFRGPVGLVDGSAGYFKDYVYDQRFLYQSPPHFIDPVEGQWGVAVYSECTGGTCS